jgi:hypothetical protein
MSHIASVSVCQVKSGDVHEVLDKLNAKFGSRAVSQISCAKLIRVDFLLLAPAQLGFRAGNEKRQVHPLEVNRLVAAFFNVITEHATVRYALTRQPQPARF